MKILVTGGAGYIGSHTVVELQNAGHEPIIIDNFRNSNRNVLQGITKITGKSPKVYEADCCAASLDRIFLEEKNIEAVIHFAALKSVSESNQIPLDYYQNNITSTIQLLISMTGNNIRNLVFSSSAIVYGRLNNLPVTEEEPLKEPTTVYGRTKQICEQIIGDVVKSSTKLESVILRYFNPIGAHPSGMIGEQPSGIPNNLVPFVTIFM